MSGVVSMEVNLRRRGLSLEAISDLCVLRRKERDTSNHLLLHCEFSSFLWSRVIGQSGVSWCSLEFAGMIEA